MDSFDRDSCEAFVELSRQRGFLTSDQSAELLRQSVDRGSHPGPLAIELGLLKSFEVDIVDAFLSPADLAPGYELVDVLGHGALGVVYLARQPRLQREVAIKSILQSRLAQQNVAARFQREGAAIGRLQHPNIVSAYDSGAHQGRLFLVMELVKGSDLQDRLADGPLDVTTSLSIARQTALGLSHALSHDIIHRDIKPGNLILTKAPAGFDLPPGVPLTKIADFGLAQLNTPDENGEDQTRLTLTGVALGTPMYCAPEQLTGDAIDHRADIYALGATLFHALAGTTPLEADTLSKVISAKITGQPTRVELLPDGVGPKIRDLILDMMAHSPKDRIADYETLIDRIDQIQYGSPARETVGSRHSAFPSKWWNRKSVVFLIGSVLLFVAIGALYGFLPPLTKTKENTDVIDVAEESSLTESLWQKALFDGQGITDWSPNFGLVDAELSDEGVAIKIANGRAVRKLEPVPVEYKDLIKGIGVRMNVDLLLADAAEIHFGFQNDSYETSRRLVARLARDGVTVGSRQGVGGKWTALGEGLPPPKFASEMPFHEIRIERLPDKWLVRFGKQSTVVGVARADREAVNDAFQLVVANGSAKFADVMMFVLLEDANADPMR